MRKKLIHKICTFFCVTVTVLTANFIATTTASAYTAITATSTYFSVTNSNISQAAPTYKFSWNPADTIDTVNKIQIDLCTTPSGTCTVPAGLAMSATPTVTVTGFATNTNTATWTVGTGIILITMTTPGAPGATVTASVTVTTNPSSGGSIYAQISDYNTGLSILYDYGVGGTVIVSNIAINGQVDPNITFTVAGLATGGGSGGACGTTTTGSNQNCSATSTATAIAFGTFSTTTTNSATQSITTSTNATHGYTVTLQETQALTSGANTIANVSASTTWTLNTTLGFGVGVTGGDVYTTNFSGNTIYQPIPVNATTLTLASKTSPTTGAGDVEFVNFEIGVNTLTPAGYYSNSVDYVVVPTF